MYVPRYSCSSNAHSRRKSIVRGLHLLTSSFGCNTFFASSSFRPSIHVPVSNHFIQVHMDCVPDPVCHTTSGNGYPVSFQDLIANFRDHLAFAFGSTSNSTFACAAAFFKIANARMTSIASAAHYFKIILASLCLRTPVNICRHLYRPSYLFRSVFHYWLIISIIAVRSHVLIDFYKSRGKRPPLRRFFTVKMIFTLSTLLRSYVLPFCLSAVRRSAVPPFRRSAYIEVRA